MAGYGGPRIDIVDDWTQVEHLHPASAESPDLPPVCAACVRQDGLCGRHQRDVLPQLAQMYWYRLVKSGYVEADNPLSAIETGCLAPDEKRRAKREARKRFKRSAKAAIATQRKRSAKRKKELVAAIRRVA